MSSLRVKVAALATIIAGATFAAPAGAQTIELKISHFIPPNHTFHKWVSAWSEKLTRESDGRLKFSIYPNGQLVGPPNRQFDAARNAITDMAFVLHGVTPGRYSLTELGNLPFTWPKAGSGSATTSRRLAELAPTYLAKEHQGLRILFAAVANPVMFYSKVPIKSIDDFKGLKIRYAGVQNKYLLDALGATPLLVPPPESQDALAKGIVDVAMFPHEAALAYDLGTVAKYAIEPGVATATFAFVMNPAKYESLPADLKALIDKYSGPAAAEDFGKAWEVAEKEGRDKEMAQGVQMLTLPPADIEKMKKLMAPHVEQAIAAVDKEGKQGRKFYEEYTK
ncbi:MAG TPA: TRAP transporter substrate-binding protein [Xanthobacteraceae bacterium]|nr:TRAP transporter substrate-binding protein [Xanthobacteraceae bacterium]